MTKIAWLGAGMMGSGFVEALRRRGDDVRVWNRTAAKAAALETFGATAVADPRAAVRGADRVHMILKDDETVDAMLAEIAGDLGAGTVVIDHTTVAVQPTKARAAWCAAHGIEFLHMPVFMSPQACRDGAGVMLASGPRARFERIESEVKKMTGELWYCGEPPEKAALLKLVGNQMIFFVTAGLGDGFALARASGFPSADVLEVFTHFKIAATVDFRGQKIVSGNLAPAFELTMARKDARLMEETAAAGGVELALLPQIAERMDRFIAAGYGDRDLAAIATELPKATA